MKREIYLLDIRQFDGEGAGAGAAGSSQADAGANAAGTSQPATDNGKDNLEAEFEALISGKYKEQFERRTQRALGKRMTTMQSDLQTAQTDAGRLKDALSARYGLKDATTDDILKAIEGDSSFLEEAAIKEGLSTENYRKMFEMQRRLAEVERNEEAAKRERFRNEYTAKLEKQEKTVKEQFPGFDLEKEYNENETFREMVKQGADLLKAYKFAHMDELLASGMAKAAQKGSERTLNAVRRNLSRPSEAGTRGQAAASVGIDWNSMSSEDFRKYQEKILTGG